MAYKVPHTHAESEVTNLTTDLTGKAASVHTHVESDVTSLVSDLAAKPSIIDTQTQTGRTASVGSTNFVGMGSNGLYRISYYIDCAALDLTAGSVVLNLAWTDGAGAKTYTSTALILTSLTQISGDVFIYRGSGTPAWSTTLTGIIAGASYDVRLVVEKLS